MQTTIEKNEEYYLKNIHSLNSAIGGLQLIEMLLDAEHSEDNREQLVKTTKLLQERLEKLKKQLKND